jgi:hypothetical protein
MPARIQRQRTKGWRMPEGAVYVGRPSLWGNPWSIGDIRAVHPEVPIADRAAVVVRKYREELTHWGLLSDWDYFTSEATYARVSAAITASGARNMAEYAAVALRGRDLACWCPLACGVSVALYGAPYGDLYEPCAKPRGHEGWHDPSVAPWCHADVLLELANR